MQASDIKRALERQEKALRLRPSMGLHTAVTTVRVRDGLVCEIEEGPWKLVADLPLDGDDSAIGPTPGVLGRGALGACLGMTYVMWAARLEIPVRNIEVEIQADFDARGDFGLDEVPPGYSEVRFTVTVESDADESTILELLDHAEKHTTYLNVFAEPQRMKRQVRLVAPRD